VLAGDRKEMARTKAAYLAFTVRNLAWYRQAALQLFGRRPALIFLLHASRLNADSVDDLAEILRKSNLTPVSLDRAMRDPVYSLPDGPLDPNGDDWLNRWAALLKRDLPWDSYPEPPAAIVATSERLDTSP